MMRPRMSVPPPGGNGRMKRTGRLGQASVVWAAAGQGAGAAPPRGANDTNPSSARRSLRPTATTPAPLGVLDVRGRCRCFGLGGRRTFLEQLRRRRVLARVVVCHARPRRNEPADDDVFLEPAQVVLLAHDRRFGENSGGLLERGRRDKRVGRQRRLGDTEQHVAVGRRFLALGLHLLVFLEHVRALHLLARDEAGFARVLDLDAPEHLPHDDLDVLVVDPDPLEAIYVLHLVRDVARERFHPLQAQDVVRVGRAVYDEFALIHDLTIVRHNVLVLRDQVLVGDALRIGDDQALLALGVLAEGHRSRDLGEQPRILGRARLEELGHARQTAGDVAGLGGLLRNAREHLAHLHLLAVPDRDERADLERDGDGMVGAGDADLLARFVQQFPLRAQALARRGAALGIDHDERREARHLVDLLGDGDAFLDVLEAHDAAVLGDDRAGMRVPRSERLPRLDGLAVGSEERCAVGHLVALALATVVVGDEHFAGAGDDYFLALRVGDVAYLRGKATGAVRLG